MSARPAFRFVSDQCRLRKLLREIRGRLSELFQTLRGNMTRCRHHDRREADGGDRGDVVNCSSVTGALLQRAGGCAILGSQPAITALHVRVRHAATSVAQMLHELLECRESILEQLVLQRRLLCTAIEHRTRRFGDQAQSSEIAGVDG